MDMRGIQKWKADNPGSVRRLSAVSELTTTTNFTNDYRTKWLSIKGNDESIAQFVTFITIKWIDRWITLFVSLLMPDPMVDTMVDPIVALYDGQ